MSKLLSDLIHKDVKPVVKPPTVGPAQILSLDESEPSSSSEEDDDKNDYYKEYAQQEMEMYAKFIKEDLESHAYMEVDDTTQELAGSDIKSSVYRFSQMSEVFKHYDFEKKFSKIDLPIDSFKEKILKVIKANSVTVIQGATGCGKSTQVPQFILDDCRINGTDCKIVVTQPRKIAAINLARRVCQERGWSLGSVCGYQIGLEKQLGVECLLAYMTTGVLLQKLIHSKNLLEYTHIIVDEVHERNQDLDFLLLIIRKFLFTNSLQTRVILMSATIEANEFAHYFRTQTRGKDITAPIVHIDEPSKFTTHIFYLEQIGDPNTMPHFEKFEPKIHDGIMKQFRFLIRCFDGIDENSKETDKTTVGSVLVFLPGIREIEEAEKMLKAPDSSNESHNEPSTSTGKPKTKWTIIPLHSSLPNDEQSRAFETPKEGYRKIILSTNIAESSITVPDITYVIDFCLTKNLVVDKLSKFPSLQLEWASHVNCEQRAGRVGRVSNGRVYRLVPHDFYMNDMERKSIPEILRAPLEQVVLHSKMLQLNEEPKAILALAINPPNLKNIETTILYLKECGAMLQTCNGRRAHLDGDMTFLGTVMASLPLHVNLSKLIVLGHMFSVLREAVVMACGCSIQNIFATPYTQRLQAYTKKLLWADGSCSDLIALLNLYTVWQSFRRDNTFKNNNDEYVWCRTNLVSLKGLREWHLLITETLARLKYLGIEETGGPAGVTLSATQKSLVLKVIICGAFYPNYFVRSAEKGQIDEKAAVRDVGGRDPFRTVYFMGMDPGQPGELYVRDIKNMLDVKDSVKVGFDGSTKIYVEFQTHHKPEPVTVNGETYITDIPGRISQQVYNAVKRRQLKYDFFLNILPKAKAWDYLKSLKKSDTKAICSTSEYDQDDTMGCFSKVAYSPIPALDIQYISIIMTERVQAGHFWAQNVNDGTQEMLSEINNILNRMPLSTVDVNSISLDKIYGAKYSKDGLIYRCKVQSTSFRGRIFVLFIDYGNTEAIPSSCLFELPSQSICQNTPPLAIECVLSGIQPSRMLNSKGSWSDEANKEFDAKTAGVLLYGKVYAVVSDVVLLELFKTLPEKRSSAISLNQWLIEQGYAEPFEEGFLSKSDHEKRQQVLSSENPNRQAELFKEQERSCEEFGPVKPELKKYMTSIRLRGPISPLEMKVYGTIINSHNKQVDIDPQSVNAVLLDNDPQDPHARLIVAAQVNQTSSGDRLILRQSTVMPSIPGFPMLMALMFCPSMEPKLTRQGDRVPGILCGLGYNEFTNKSIFPSHDMILRLDTELDSVTMNMVNQMRYLMNVSLKVMADIYDTDNRTDEIESYQRSMKTKLFKLLGRQLKSMPLAFVDHMEEWNKPNCDCEMLRVEDSDEMYVWPLHWFVKLKDQETNDSVIHKNLMDMQMIVKRIAPESSIKCILCEALLETSRDIVRHLLADSHKQKETAFRAKSSLY